MWIVQSKKILETGIEKQVVTVYNIKSCFCEAQTKLATFCTVIPLAQYDLYFIIIFKSLQLSFYHLHIFWYWLAAKIILYIIFLSYNSFVIRSHIYQ